MKPPEDISTAEGASRALTAIPASAQGEITIREAVQLATTQRNWKRILAWEKRRTVEKTQASRVVIRGLSITNP
jgi:hypothetical protein